jgi:hypothetical protein
MRRIIIVMILLMGCSAPKYFIEERQAGLNTQIIAPDSCTIEKIDTVYNPLGGVVKTYILKCKEKK